MGDEYGDSRGGGRRTRTTSNKKHQGGMDRGIYRGSPAHDVADSSYQALSPRGQESKGNDKPLAFPLPVHPARSPPPCWQQRRRALETVPTPSRHQLPPAFLSVKKGAGAGCCGKLTGGRATARGEAFGSSGVILDKRDGESLERSALPPTD